MLWAHEVLRVFSDRLIDHNSIHDDERKCSGGTLAACGHQLTQDAVQDEQELSKSSEDIFCSEQKLVFGDYTKMGVPRDDHKKKSSEYHSASRSGRLFSFSCRRKWRSYKEHLEKLMAEATERAAQLKGTASALAASEYKVRRLTSDLKEVKERVAEGKELEKEMVECE
jgi:hypothetical protein